MSGAVYRLGSAPVVFAWCLCSVGIPAALGSDRSSEQTGKPRLLTLHRLDAYLEFKSDFRYNRVDSPARGGPRNSRSQTNREWGFEERLGLRLSGTLIDPGFITFHGDLSFALTQDHYDEFGTDLDTRRDSDTGYLMQYDLRVNFFQGKELSGSVYGVRQDDRFSRRFQPTLDERRTGFGTNWTWASDTFPMELSYDYLHTDRTGNADGRNNEEYVESTFHYGVDWLIDEHHHIKFTFDHSETEQEFQGRRDRFQTTRDLFKIEHQLAFGPAHKHEFRTLIRWQEESGDFARDIFEIGPQLTLRHTDNLQTSYRYQFNRERYAGLDIETQRADFQLVHQLYTNLTTTLDVFGLHADIRSDIT
ncbi:MAG: hypothetical protein IIB57_16695, partial [Planctomycetes bacterium]|nr:hypothetical protein [Planctomycetota bacterium]